MSDLAQRAVKVRLLLQTLNDPFPTPRGALRTDPGPAASAYVPCETCKRRGWVKQRSAWVLCLACDGRGWRRRERGEPEWDSYMQLPVEEAVQLPAEEPRSTIARADQEEDSYGWERALRVYERHGSYRQVRLHLDWLGDRYPRPHRLVTAVLVNAEPRRLTAGDVRQVDFGVLAIAVRMKRVKVPSWLMEPKLAQERRESIAALARQGLTAGEIARRLGVRKETVRRRLKAVESGPAGVPARAT